MKYTGVLSASGVLLIAFATMTSALPTPAHHGLQPPINQLTDPNHQNSAQSSSSGPHPLTHGQGQHLEDNHKREDTPASPPPPSSEQMGQHRGHGGPRGGSPGGSRKAVNGGQNKMADPPQEGNKTASPQPSTKRDDTPSPQQASQDGNNHVKHSHGHRTHGGPHGKPMVGGPPTQNNQAPPPQSPTKRDDVPPPASPQPGAPDAQHPQPNGQAPPSHGHRHHGGPRMKMAGGPQNGGHPPPPPPNGASPQNSPPIQSRHEKTSSHSPIAVPSSKDKEIDPVPGIKRARPLNGPHSVETREADHDHHHDNGSKHQSYHNNKAVKQMNAQAGTGSEAPVENSVSPGGATAVTAGTAGLQTRDNGDDHGRKSHHNHNAFKQGNSQAIPGPESTVNTPGTV